MEGSDRASWREDPHTSNPLVSIGVVTWPLCADHATDQATLRSEVVSVRSAALYFSQRLALMQNPLCLPTLFNKGFRAR